MYVGKWGRNKKNWWTYLELLTWLVILGIDCQINTIFFLELLSEITRKFESYRCSIKVVQLILMRSPEIIVLTLTRENEILLILPVEVGSLSHYLHIFTRFYTSKQWLPWDFWTIKSYVLCICGKLQLMVAWWDYIGGLWCFTSLEHPYEWKWEYASGE